MRKKQYLCKVLIFYMRISKQIVLAFLLIFISTGAICQERDASSDLKKRTEVIALKTNLLYDAAATPNLELEFRLTDKWSLEVGAGFNPFPLDDKVFPKWRHVSAWIAPRYWFCHVFNRGFLSFNAAYAHYNVAGDAYPIAWMYPQVKESRYQGDAVMAGVSYGWHFAISPHFSIELEGGIEAGYSWYSQFECKHCGTKKEDGGRWLLLPKLGVNLSVPLGGDEASFAARRCDCEKLEMPESQDTISSPSEAPAEQAIAQAAPETQEEPAVQEAPAAQEAPAEQAIAQTAPAKKSKSAVVKPKYEPVLPLNSKRYLPEPKWAMAVVPKFEPTISEAQQKQFNTMLSVAPRSMFIFFEVDVAKMDRSFIDNEQHMDSIHRVLERVKADTTLYVARIEIEGLASFDGRLRYNERLAGYRAQAIKSYIQRAYHLPDSVFEVTNGGESWIKLREDLQTVEFEGRDEVLQIIENEPDFDARERQIKALHDGNTYRYMRDELRQIMRNLGCITIYVERK